VTTGSQASPTADGVAAADSLRGAQQGLFVRKSSGLVREMGLRDAISVALSGINPATVVAIFFSYLAFASNADLSWPYVVAVLAMIPLTLTYGQLVASMPRSGGDFVYLSRIFSPVVGAFIGVGFVIFSFLNIGFNAISVAENGLPEFFRTAGAALNIDAFTTFSGTLGTNAAHFITGAVIVIGVCLIGLRGAHVLARTMWWCFVAALIGLFFFIIEAVAHSSSSLISAYNHANGAHAYQNVIAAATRNGIATGNTASGFLKILPYAAIGFWGFTIANYPAGEMKRPGRTYTWATMAGLIGGAVFLILGWIAVKHLAGLHFLQASSALSSANPAAFAHATGGGAPTYTQYYVDLVSPGALAMIISAAFSIGGLMFVIAMVLIISRLLFALAFDRLLPTRLADVSEKTHAPTKALLVAMVGGVLFVYLVVYSTGFVHATRNQVLIWAFVFTVGSIAGAVLPFRRRDLYEASPKIIDGKWFGLPPVTVIALVSALIQGTLLVVAATNASINGGYDAGSIATLLSFGIAGIVVYAISRIYLKRRDGIDVTLAMRELPPE
jgi:APA family basic amino acid/polyamine antiporter